MCVLKQSQPLNTRHHFIITVTPQGMSQQTFSRSSVGKTWCFRTAGIPTGRERQVSFKFRGIILELQPRELELEALSLPQCLVNLRSLGTGPWRVPHQQSAAPLTPHIIRDLPAYLPALATIGGQPLCTPLSLSLWCTQLTNTKNRGERKMCFCF